MKKLKGKFEHIDEVLRGTASTKTVSSLDLWSLDFSENQTSTTSSQWNKIHKFIKGWFYLNAKHLHLGSLENSRLNNYFVISKVKNQIFACIKSVKEHHETLFKSFNTFKAYLYEKVLLPKISLLRSKHRISNWQRYGDFLGIFLTYIPCILT